ncbi:hypothetical protein [Haliangium sp.]|uniref:hypothetical protein n=1 Tax=Haliangium sp. TaxID=2663208 RepID=UPI003D1192B3
MKSAGRTALGHLALLICVGVACEPTPATDKDAHREENRRMLDTNRFWSEYALMNRQVNREFAERFKGRVVPGVGCRVCPSLCTVADLRPIGVAEFQERFRRAAIVVHSDADYREILHATRESERLGCIAASGSDAKRYALLQLMDPAESRVVRYQAARQAQALELAGDQPERVLRELSSSL